MMIKSFKTIIGSFCQAHFLPLFLGFFIFMVNATPPPEVFINVKSAGMIGEDILQVKFDYPQCDDPRNVFYELVSVSFDKTIHDENYGEFALNLVELREKAGVPLCTGPMKTQKLKIDITVVLPDQRVRSGVIHINYEPLYGPQGKLKSFKVPFYFKYPLHID